MNAHTSDEHWRQLTLGLFRRPVMSFESFYAGPNLEATRACAQWAAGTGPGCLLLWGGGESGKSHLLQAAVGAVVTPDVPTMYLPLREAVRYGPQVLEDLDGLAALCLDDLECVAADPAWAQALFDLYNRLQLNGRRLLMSATAAPHELPIALPDLRSRLAASLIYHLEALGDEDKNRALTNAAARRGMVMSEGVAQFLLRRLPRDWAGLQTALEELDRTAHSAGRVLTVPFVRTALRLGD